MKSRFLMIVVLGSNLFLSLFIAFAQNENSLNLTAMGNTQFPGVGIDFVYQTGGQMKAVAVQGDYVYLGLSHRLVVLNKLNPNELIRVGQSKPLPYPILDVAVLNNYAYVTLGRQDRISGTSYGGLMVFDISDPTEPIIINHLDTLTRFYGVAVKGQSLYLTGWDTGRIVDISTPSSPVALGFYDADLICEAFVSHYAYCYPAVNNTLTVLDVADRSNPVVVKTLTWTPNTTSVSDIKIAGNYAYVAANIGDYGYAKNSLLFVLDITNSANPSIVVTHEWGDDFAEKIDIVGDYAYVFHWNSLWIPSSTQIDIFDISNPLQPQQVGDYDPDAGYVRDAVVVGNEIVFLSDKLTRISLSDPVNPVKTASYQEIGNSRSVIALEEYIYLFFEDGFTVFDIEDREAPVQLSFQPIGDGTRPFHLDNYLVFGDQNAQNALSIVDVSDPTMPTELSFLDDFNNIVGMAGYGDYLYIADYIDGLFILDISDPSNPTQVGSYDPGTLYTYDVVFVYPYVYLVSSGLFILDVSNPEMPQEINFIAGGQWQGRHLVNGNYLYILQQGGLNPDTLSVYDVSNPLSPTHVEEIDLPRPDSNIIGSYMNVKGDYIFVAGERVVRVIDASDPTSLVVRGIYETPHAQDVAVVDNYLYIADEGLYVFEYTPVITASIPISGGNLISAFDQTNYLFGSDTFSETVTVKHYVYDADTLVPAGSNLMHIDHFFKNTAVTSTTLPLSPTRPYTLTIQYSDAEKGAAIEATLMLYSWNGTSWMPEPSSIVYNDTNTITAVPNHFGLWAILGDTNRYYLPLIVK